MSSKQTHEFAVFRDLSRKWDDRKVYNVWPISKRENERQAEKRRGRMDREMRRREVWKKRRRGWLQRGKKEVIKSSCRKPEETKTGGRQKSRKMKVRWKRRSQQKMRKKWGRKVTRKMTLCCASSFSSDSGAEVTVQRRRCKITGSLFSNPNDCINTGRSRLTVSPVSTRKLRVQVTET